MRVPKPIVRTVHASLATPPELVSDGLLELSRWPEFTGHLLLPGIKSAAFEVRTPNGLGSRIRVHNLEPRRVDTR